MSEELNGSAESTTSAQSNLTPVVPENKEQPAVQIPSVSGSDLTPTPPKPEGEQVAPAAAAEQQEQVQEATPAAEAKEEPPKSETHQPQKHKRPRMTQFEKRETWVKILKGSYTDEQLVMVIANYALENGGFNTKFHWGFELVRMFERMHWMLRNSLRTFTPQDAEYLQKELLRFLNEQPLGDNIMVWNEKFPTNVEQRNAIEEFFGIRKTFRELRGTQNIVMTAFKDATWPRKQEAETLRGGTYAERFHYLAIAVSMFCSTDPAYAEAIFRDAYHDKPTQEFLDRVNGIRRVPGASRTGTDPDWIGPDGKCKRCGNDVVTDSRGNKVCKSFNCPNHWATVSMLTPKSFFHRDDNHAAITDGGEQTAVPAQDQRPHHKKVNWKKRRDNDENEVGFERHQKKHGPRFRPNEDEEIPSPENHEEEPKTVATAGTDFQNNAFAGLSLPGGGSNQDGTTNSETGV